MRKCFEINEKIYLLLVANSPRICQLSKSLQLLESFIKDFFPRV